MVDDIVEFVTLITPVVNVIKDSTIVIYYSRVALTINCLYYDSRTVIYDRKNVYKIGHRPKLFT